MELIHICERDISIRTFLQIHEEKFSLENSALKQKTFRIVKEQHDVVGHRAINRRYL